MSTFRVRLSGEVDMARAGELRAILQEFRKNPAKDAEVDMSAVTFADTTALSMLLRVHAAAYRRGGTVTLVRPPDSFVRVLAITCLAPLFRVVDAREEQAQVEIDRKASSVAYRR
jgi:anti-sigma B factor antagonist